MANSYTKIYIQIVFAVKFRNAVIGPEIKDLVEKYITGIVKNRKHSLISIYAMPDHVHIFIRYHPEHALSDLLRDLKSSSAKYINENKLLRSRFQWQDGFSAFSYSESSVQNVVNYIQNQKEHHRKKSFREEYLNFLKEFDIDYDEKYIFKDLE